MRRQFGNAVDAFVYAAALGAGVWLVQELRDPYSDVRLRASELLDRLREVKKR